MVLEISLVFLVAVAFVAVAMLMSGRRSSIDEPPAKAPERGPQASVCLVCGKLSMGGHAICDECRQDLANSRAKPSREGEAR